MVDESFGCLCDGLFWIFSAGKPYVATLIHLLAEQHLLSLDDPVAAYWPAFARHGKQQVTIRHVLQHRTGLPSAGRPGLRDTLVVTDWQRALSRIEHQRLADRPGAVAAYQAVSFGFILGEVASRVTGMPLPQLLRTRLLEPLGAHDTHLGLAQEQWPRHVPIRANGAAGMVLAPLVNSRRTRIAVIPSAGISTTAHDLATFYLMLLRARRGEPGLPVTQATTTQAVIPTSDGQIDQSTGARPAGRKAFSSAARVRSRARSHRSDSSAARASSDTTAAAAASRGPTPTVNSPSPTSPTG